MPEIPAQRHQGEITFFAWGKSRDFTQRSKEVARKGSKEKLTQNSKGVVDNPVANSILIRVDIIQTGLSPPHIIFMLQRQTRTYCL